jgi:hypothetical protein
MILKSFELSPTEINYNMTTFLQYYKPVEGTTDLLLIRINNDAKNNKWKIVQHQIIFDRNMCIHGISVLFETIEEVTDNLLLFG